MKQTLTNMERINLDRVFRGYPQLMKWTPQGEEATIEIVSENGIDIGQELQHSGKLNDRDYTQIVEISEVIEQRKAKGQHENPKVFQILKGKTIK